MRGDDALLEHTRRFDCEGFQLSDLRVAIPMLESARSLVPPEIGGRTGAGKRTPVAFSSAPAAARHRICGRRRNALRAGSQALAFDRGLCAALGRADLDSDGRDSGKDCRSVANRRALAAELGRIRRAAALRVRALRRRRAVRASAAPRRLRPAAFGTRSIQRSTRSSGAAVVGRPKPSGKSLADAESTRLPGLRRFWSSPMRAPTASTSWASFSPVAELPGVTRLAVLSESRPLLDAVAQLIDTLDLRTLERSDFVSSAISQNCRLIAAASRDELFDLLNRFAPAVFVPAGARRLGILGEGFCRAGPSLSAMRRRWSAGSIWPEPTGSRRPRARRVSRRVSAGRFHAYASASLKIAPIG